jgi:hypothetical protein
VLVGWLAFDASLRSADRQGRNHSRVMLLLFVVVVNWGAVRGRCCLSFGLKNPGHLSEEVCVLCVTVFYVGCAVGMPPIMSLTLHGIKV